VWSKVFGTLKDAQVCACQREVAYDVGSNGRT
jgi:hypothetical protein